MLVCPIIIMFFVKKMIMCIIIVVFYCTIFTIMTPNQIPTWGLNIDQMLQNLSTVPQVADMVAPSTPLPEVNFVSPVLHEPTLWTTFSVENIVKPVSSPVPHIPEQIASRSFLSSRGVRATASVVSTLLLIVIWGFVVSKQYPVETEQLFGVVDTVVATTEKNIQPDTIVVENSIGTWSDIETHGVAPDNYITDTPLVDAIAESQNSLTQDTPTEQILTTVIGDAPIASWSLDTTVVSESTPTDIQLPSVDKTQTNDQLKWKLLVLAQSAEEAMTNLIGNSDVKMAKMRAVYKKSQALITQLSDESFIPDTTFIDQIIQLQSLYDSTVMQ